MALQVVYQSNVVLLGAIESCSMLRPATQSIISYTHVYTHLIFQYVVDYNGFYHCMVVQSISDGFVTCHAHHILSHQLPHQPWLAPDHSTRPPLLHRQRAKVGANKPIWLHQINQVRKQRSAKGLRARQRQWVLWCTTSSFLAFYH